jgi:hypothetical protein
MLHLPLPPLALPDIFLSYFMAFTERGAIAFPPLLPGPQFSFVQGPKAGRFPVAIRQIHWTGTVVLPHATRPCLVGAR